MQEDGRLHPLQISNIEMDIMLFKMHQEGKSKLDSTLYMDILQMKRQYGVSHYFFSLYMNANALFRSLPVLDEKDQLLVEESNREMQLHEADRKLASFDKDALRLYNEAARNSNPSLIRFQSFLMGTAFRNKDNNLIPLLNSHVLKHIFGYLKSMEQNNLPFKANPWMADCQCKVSQAQLQFGNPEQALANANKALQSSPLDWKAHSHKQNAILALHGFEAAEQYRSHVRCLEKMKEIWWEGHILAYSGHFTPETFYIAQKIRWQRILDHLKDKTAVSSPSEYINTVHVNAAIVPFPEIIPTCGGSQQWIVLDLEYVNSNDHVVRIDGVHTIQLESMGGDGLSARQNEPGHASEKAVMKASLVIIKFVAGLREEGISVPLVSLGQGLSPLLGSSYKSSLSEALGADLVRAK